jgi:hypothetical protein
MKTSAKFEVLLEERVMLDVSEAFNYYNDISIALGNNF